MKDRKTLEAQAAQCRRLAAGVTDRRTAEDLLRFAGQLDVTCRELAQDEASTREAPPPPPGYP